LKGKRLKKRVIKDFWWGIHPKSKNSEKPTILTIFKLWNNPEQSQQIPVQGSNPVAMKQII
jgi:hypothetical protein